MVSATVSATISAMVSATTSAMMSATISAMVSATTSAMMSATMSATTSATMSATTTSAMMSDCGGLHLSASVENTSTWTCLATRFRWQVHENQSRASFNLLLHQQKGQNLLDQFCQSTVSLRIASLAATNAALE